MWMNPANGRMEAVPRHTEIANRLARKICRGWVKPADLPSNAEVRDEIQSFARLRPRRSSNVRVVAKHCAR